MSEETSCSDAIEAPETGEGARAEFTPEQQEFVDRLVGQARRAERAKVADELAELQANDTAAQQTLQIAERELLKLQRLNALDVRLPEAYLVRIGGESVDAVDASIAATQREFLEDQQSFGAKARPSIGGPSHAGEQPAPPQPVRADFGTRMRDYEALSRGAE